MRPLNIGRHVSMAYKLSICIPTYNRIACLKSTLGQICSMVEKDGYAEQIEVCVSDNGSDDGSWDFLENASTQFSFLSIRRNQDNQGFGRNFWHAAKMAKGEYIFFTGDDDSFPSDALKTLIMHTDGSSGLVLFNSHPTYAFRGDLFTDSEAVSIESIQRYLECLGVFHGSFIGNLMFRREVFLRHCNIGDAVFLSAYPHLFPVFRVIHEGSALFVNSRISDPDDGVRSWRKMQPIYTSIDLARIVKQEVIAHVDKSIGRKLKLELARSLPRAIWCRLKGEVSIDPLNPFQSVRPSNILSIYR